MPALPPPDLAIIRACHDHLSMQLYAFKDAKGQLWYGPLVKGGGADVVKLVPEALDQVCPSRDDKKDSPA